MNLLHLISARHYVGEAARVLDLAEEQLALGHNVTVVTRGGYDVAAEAERRGLPREEAIFSSGFSPFADCADVALIRRLAERTQADLVHAHRGKDHWLGALALLGKKIPLVRTRHVVTPVRPHAGNRWLYGRRTAGIIAVSAAAGAELRRSLPWYGGPVRVIPGGPRAAELQDGPETAAAEKKMRRRLHLGDEARVLLLLARLARVKGQIYAIEALPAIVGRVPEAVLLLAYSRGSHYRQEVEERIRALGLRDHVRWLAKVDDLSPLLALAELGLVTSVGSEGWSRTAVEFLHAGKPVIASAVGSLPEIVRHGETGLIVPPRQPEALAAAALRLLENSDTRARMSSAALQAARQYTATRMATDELAFYAEILGGTRETA